jgi:hypothetical protein
MDLDFRSLWDRALPYSRFARESKQNCALWTGVYRLARIPDWALADARASGGGRRLLVIAEDWCGDASNTVPYLAKLGDEAGSLELRVLRRDEHPEVMDRYLTGTARAIPIVIVLDEAFHELGHWGPRPAELQRWLLAARQTTPKDQLYPHARRWYAMDKGQSTMREVLALVAFASRPTAVEADSRQLMADGVQ